MVPDSSAGPWTPPAELGRNCPRRVRLTVRGKVTVGLGLVLLLGAGPLGIFLDGYARGHNRDTLLLEKRGVAASANIVELNQSGRSSSYDVVYRFVYGGRSYRNEVSVSEEIGRTLSTAAALPIRVLPGRPDLNHPTGWRREDVPLWLSYELVVLMAAVGAAMLIKVRRQFRLLSMGRAAPGRITGMMRFPRRRARRYRYEFRLSSGTLGTGVNRCARGGAIGEPVCVLYDPDNPGRKAVYPFCLTQVDSVTRI